MNESIVREPTDESPYRVTARRLPDPDAEEFDVVIARCTTPLE